MDNTQDYLWFFPFYCNFSDTVIIITEYTCLNSDCWDLDNIFLCKLVNGFFFITDFFITKNVFFLINCWKIEPTY